MLDFINLIRDNINPVVVFPIATIYLLLLFFWYYVKILQPEKGSSEWIGMKVDKPNRLTFLTHRYTMTRSDIIPLTVILFVFFSLAIINLGSTNNVDVLAELVLFRQGENRSGNHLENLYFDEIYFITTAAQHIEGIFPYEWTHPPLGKEIIASSILLFGMNPFGWRFIGAVCGVIMLAVMYIFVKNMFGKTAIATCATLLLGFDFMRFVQTRLGTIDTYVVLFILLAFFFMYRHITTDEEANFRKSLVPLALSGIFFGLSFSVKWVGFYAGAGLFLIYIIRLAQLYVFYRDTEKVGYAKYLVKTLLFSVLFFVIVPVTVYYLTYIPYGIARGMTIGDGMLWDPRYLEIVWNNQMSMFNYHNDLVAEHPYSSTWWQWLLNIRPILYVNNRAGDLRASFGAFGNPVVWWGGLVAMLFMVFRLFKYKDGKALFILIGYLSSLLPWVAVTRIVFAYHYFPSTLFLVLAIAHIFNTMFERNKRENKFHVYGFTITAGIVFAMFYPALAGFFLPDWYYKNFLKWLGTWPF
ncbi:MAG: phospholipid carrier-dependent glycosyltransferase [Oscillospiraceae bacterium]|jgi:dolichyl-phosphate-mannose--protein O-mannosyl transferase|nr:phospholipid carrier-dependent glycosyltransferase [Oscillospiraceae bacterium]